MEQGGRVPVSRTRTDALFGQIALQHAYVTPEVLRECILEQHAQSERTETTLRLGQILLKRKALSLEQFLAVLKEQKRRILSCPKCRAVFDVGDRATAATVFCLKCEESLTLPPVATDAPFRSLGRFQIVRELAHGGMGIIYEAEDRDLGRKVALKVLRETSRADQSAERFRQEAVLAARLEHPQIIRIHELGMIREESDPAPTHYIAMEFVDGGTFETEMERLPLDGRIHVLEKVARALGFAHARGICHRDLKPSNILMTRAGEPVVTDFGLARCVSGKARLTEKGEVLGTPLYMAPEQIEGIRPLDARTDVWALGVILYEVLTGQPPFNDPTPAGLYESIQRRDPVLPRLRRAGLSHDLEAICLKALEKEPSRRYPTAYQFADDLRRWREGAPVRARSRGPLSRILRRMRRDRRRLAGLGIAFVLGFLCALALASHRAPAYRGRVANCSTSVEPASAVVSDRPPVIVRSTSSK